MTISPKLVSFIVAQEDGDEAYYDKTEEHFDWPGGASGPTVGVGYDLGYCTSAECRSDWAGIVDQQMIDAMVDGVQRTGEIAHAWVQEHRSEVTITWAQALQEFTLREIPKWENRVRLALPNYDDLPSDDCRGVLVSLSYNRGTGGYNSTLPRFTEMRNIRVAMEQKQYNLIPALISSMVRLWPNVYDLRHRRILESRLFAEGLQEATA
jgi:hypothetical protein